MAVDDLSADDDKYDDLATAIGLSAEQANAIFRGAEVDADEDLPDSDVDQHGQTKSGYSSTWWRTRRAHMAKTSTGRDLHDPIELLTACYEYFDYASRHAIYEAKAFSYEGHVTMKPVPKARPFTIRGLSLFLGLSSGHVWARWRQKSERRSPEDYPIGPVVLHVEDIIYNQKYEMAAAGLLNPTIIARDLGLVDRQDVTSADKAITPKTITRVIIDPAKARAGGSTA